MHEWLNGYVNVTCMVSVWNLREQNVDIDLNNRLISVFELLHTWQVLYLRTKHNVELNDKKLKGNYTQIHLNSKKNSHVAKGIVRLPLNDYESEAPRTAPIRPSPSIEQIWCVIVCVVLYLRFIAVVIPQRIKVHLNIWIKVVHVYISLTLY